MTLLSRIANLIKKLRNRTREEEDLEEEIRFHLEKETEENIQKGMQPMAAKQAAIKAFGGKMAAKEDCHASWGVRVFDDLESDIRCGIRQIFKHKFHSLIVILTLALCMGANTTAFNFFRSIVSDSYDYVDEERIVRVGKMYEKMQGEIVGQISVVHFQFFQEHCDSFTDIGFVDNEVYRDMNLSGKIRRISTDQISAGVWDVVGINPLLGRFFTEKDIKTTNGKVVVLSERLWRELKNDDADMIGESIVLDGDPYEVIGVAPKSFYLEMMRVEAWVPRIFQDMELRGDQRNNHSYTSIAKLKTGVSIDEARLRMRSIYESLLAIYPEDVDDQIRHGSTFGVVEVRNAALQNIPQIRIAFSSIRWVTMMVLLIGCLNVGGMILVRGFARLQEFAMRSALGASISRLARQLYVEIFLYFLLGGILSLFILKAGLMSTRLLRLDEIPWVGEWSIDLNSIGVTAVFIIVSATITGAMPLIALFRKNIMELVKSGNQTASNSPAKHRMHSFFVVSQVTLSVILMVASGLLVRNLLAVMNRDIGFERNGRIAISVPHPGYRFGWDKESYLSKNIPYQTRMIETIRNMPGVIHASASSRIPISGGNMGHSEFNMPHYTYDAGEAKGNALRVLVRDGYFDTVGTKLLMGRDFEETDHFDAEGVIIISQNTMERYFKGLNPVGMILRFWGRNLRIIGVAEQVQDKPFFMSWDECTLYFHYPQWEHMNRQHSIFIAHVEGDIFSQLRNIEEAILRVDPDAVIDGSTFDEHYESALFAQKMPMIITLFLSSVAIFLTGLGLYGLVSFTVLERTREYGIRMALGARSSLIFKRILNSSIRLTIIGLLVGTGISAMACWKINPMLEDIDTTAPFPFLIVLVVVTTICTMASLMPAIRATRINVIEILRYE